MLKNGLKDLIMIALITNQTVAKADVDCTKRPKFVEPRVCCPVPDFVTAELKEKCQEFNTTLPPPLAVSGEQSVEGKRHHHHHHHTSPVSSLVRKRERSTCVLFE